MNMDKASASIELTTNTIPHYTIGQKHIDWKLAMTKAEQAQSVALNADVTFKWSGTHNVWLLPNKDAYDACDFSQGKELASTSVNEYTYKASAAGTFYFASQVTGQCKFANQKLALTVTPAPTPAPTTTAGTMHCVTID